MTMIDNVDRYLFVGVKQRQVRRRPIKRGSKEKENGEHCKGGEFRLYKRAEGRTNDPEMTEKGKMKRRVGVYKCTGVE